MDAFSMFKDKRSGKITLIAHCILNQNSRALALAERSSVITEIVEFLTRNEIGIIQMPCPELAYAGVLRQPQTQDQYDNVTFRRLCREMAKEVANQIQEYDKCGIKLKVVIGVDGSPSCGVKDSGILMKELHLALDKRRISVPFYGVHNKRLKDDVIELGKYIK